MATVTEPQARSSLLFEDVTWDDYEAMLKIVGGNPIRVTYDDGRMEIMSPQGRHGGFSYLLGRLIDVLTEEWDIPVEAGDPVTFNRRDIGKGVEPDTCYYLGPNAAMVRGKGLFSFFDEGHTECCGIRKVEPLRRRLATLDAWITGQRRDQSPTRAAVPVVQEDAAFSTPGVFPERSAITPVMNGSSISVSVS